MLGPTMLSILLQPIVGAAADSVGLELKGQVWGHKWVDRKGGPIMVSLKNRRFQEGKIIGPHYWSTFWFMCLTPVICPIGPAMGPLMGPAMGPRDGSTYGSGYGSNYGSWLWILLWVQPCAP